MNSRRQLARKALRVLASAYRDLDATSVVGLEPSNVEQDLVFVGLCGMYDPPRPEAQAAVTACHNAGIRVVMITGDHPETAIAIARQIGLASPTETAVEGSSIESLSQDELSKRVTGIIVYARVTAEHKLRIIRAWKHNEAVVAMTGDGVNDAPAIQGADIGIAMGRSGTEVTRQASDLIITDDNFASIVAAVEEGRGIYDNIRKTLQYLLAGNTGELLLMTLAVVLGFPAPLLPIHLLWINLVTDGLPALCLAADRIDPTVMKRHPRPRSERLTNRSFLLTMFITGILTAGVAFGVFLHVLRTGTVEEARTAAFTVLVYAELLRAFGARNPLKPLWRSQRPISALLAAVVFASIGLHVLSHHNDWISRFLRTTPLPFLNDLILLALGAIPLLILEVVKSLREPRDLSTDHKGITPWRPPDPTRNLSLSPALVPTATPGRTEPRTKPEQANSLKMNKLEIKGDWNIIRGILKQKWGKLTDDDLQYADGKHDELLGRIQKRTGATREVVEKAIKDASDSCACK